MKNIIKKTQNCSKLKKYAMTVLAAVVIGASSISFGMQKQKELTEQDKALISAIEIGDTKKVIEALGKGANPNIAYGEHGTTPLNRACYENNREIVRLLLEKRANVNAVVTNGDTPLNRACYYNYPKIVGLLLEYSANPNIANKNGETPLYRACRENNLEIVRLLLDKGANVNVVVADGFYKGESAFYWACVHRDLDMVRILLEKVRSELGQSGAQEFINKVDNGNTPLKTAYLFHNLKMVELLLEYGANPNIADKDDSIPLNWACYENNLELVRLFLKYGAKESVNKANKDGYTPLNRACFSDNLDIVKLLLENGAKESVNIANNYGNTPLNWACHSHKKDPEIVKLLLDNGAQESINIANNDGETPLYQACVLLNREMVKLLLIYGANVDQKSLEKVQENLQIPWKSAVAAQILEMLNLAQKFDKCVKSDEFFELSKKENKNVELCNFRKSLITGERAKIIMVKKPLCISSAKDVPQGQEIFGRAKKFSDCRIHCE